MVKAITIILWEICLLIRKFSGSFSMGLLPETQKCGLRMRRECRKLFPRHPGLAIPTCTTACASSTCRGVCRDRQLAVSFEVSGGESVPGIPGAWATRKYVYLVRGPLYLTSIIRSPYYWNILVQNVIYSDTAITSWHQYINSMYSVGHSLTY